MRIKQIQPSFYSVCHSSLIANHGDTGAIDQECGDSQRMKIRTASLEDVATYAALARDAQAWLQSRGLGQYIPAAHDEYADAVQARAKACTLYAVEDGDAPIAFFSLEPNPTQWWPPDQTPALYLVGMVVDRQARGRKVGEQIIEWCKAEAVRRARRFLRLDCHADNRWLCGYYERHGFVLVRRLQQHPGYYGCLYQLAVAND